jgi:hypothetical protein
MAQNRAGDTTIPADKAKSSSSSSHTPPQGTGKPPRVSIGIVIKTCCCKPAGQGDKSANDSPEAGQGDETHLRKVGQSDKSANESPESGQGDDFTFMAGDVAIKIEICT